MSTFLHSIFGSPKSPELAVDPRGVLLVGSDAEEVIEKWEEQVEEVGENRVKIENVIPRMEDRMKELESKVKAAASEVAEHKKKFNEVSTPVAKERWARRLIASDRLLKYLRESHSMMKLNAQRAEASVEDAVMIGRLLDEKIADARLYFDLNGQIRLIGTALAAAENIHDRTKSVEKDMEVSMEGLEGLVEKLEGKDLLLEAEKISKRNFRQDNDAE